MARAGRSAGVRRLPSPLPTASSALPSVEPSRENLIPRLFVVGDFYRIRFRVRLTGQNEPFIEVLLLEHVVDFHVDFAAAQCAGTRPAVAFAAGERRIQPFGE